MVIAGDAKGALASMTAVDRKAGGLGSSFRMMGSAAAAGFVAVSAAAVGAGVALYGIGSQFDSAYDPPPRDAVGIVWAPLLAEHVLLAVDVEVLVAVGAAHGAGGYARPRPGRRRLSKAGKRR